MAAIQTNPYNDPNYLGGGYYFGTGNDQLPGGGGLNTIGKTILAMGYCAGSVIAIVYHVDMTI